MADNIQTELGVDANVPVYANAKEAKKAEKEAKKEAKKAAKEAKKADKRRAKAEKAIEKSINKCQKAIKKAEKEKDPVKRQKAVAKAREKLEKSIEKTSKKYPTETKEIIAEKERANAAKRAKMHTAPQAQPTGRTQEQKQPEKAFNGIASAYDRAPEANTPSPSNNPMSAMGAAANAPGKSNTGDPLVDAFVDMIMAWMKAQQEAFEKRLVERENAKRLEEERKLAQTRSSSGKETDALTQTSTTKTQVQPSLALSALNANRGRG